MRVTQNMIARFGLQQLNQQRSQLAQTQEQASTGRSINRPSDNPVGYREVRETSDEIAQTGQFIRSIDASRTRIAVAESAISDAAQLVSEARVQALSALNAPNEGEPARDAIKEQVEGLFEQLLSLSNTKSAGGAFVFSGNESDTQAFEQTGTFVSGNPPPVVAYAGDGGVLEVEIDQGVFVEVTADGSQVFQGDTDVFAALGTLWEGLDSNDPALLNSALTDLISATDQLLLEQAKVGSQEAKAIRFEERLRDQEVAATQRLSLIEDADVFEVYSSLVSQETSLQATLSVNARLLSPSLLDFI